MKITCSCGEELDFSEKNGKINEQNSNIEIGVDLDTNTTFIRCLSCGECLELH